MRIVNEIKRTSWICPSQWQGKTDKNEAVNIRYRWGTLTIYVDFAVVYSKHLGKSTTEKDDEVVYEIMRRQGWDECVIAKVKLATDTHRVKVSEEGNVLSFDGFMTYEDLKQYTKDILVLPTNDY